MEFVMRRFNSNEDFWRIRDFLRLVISLRGKPDLSWHISRFDYWRWHGIENLQAYPTLDAATFIWERKHRQIVAVLNPEGGGEAFLQVHPDFYVHGIIDEMVIVAEEQLAIVNPNGVRKIKVWCNEHNLILQAILIARGYMREVDAEYQRRREIDQQIPQVVETPGYVVRSLGDIDELPSRSWASWKAFHPDEPDERYEGWEWYLNIQRIPLYRRDLDLVSVAPNGEIAGFCTVWFDDVTRSAYFEPVGVMPLHQRRGLGKALMCEGLKRLERLGATRAFVSSYGPSAHALYASSGFVEFDLSEAWLKVF